MQLTELLNKFKRKRTSVKADFKAFLRQNNCKSAEYHDKDDKSTRYYFDYQGGHFVADISRAMLWLTTANLISPAATRSSSCSAP